MNGNRGAKGSVNDRVISYLFRKRYLEYLKKRESYTKEEREKAIEYLKKTKDFDIENNVSMLDDQDKELLEEAFIGFDISNITPNNNHNNISIDDDLTAIDKDTMTINQDYENYSKQLEEFDPLSENFDFENYDYYEIINDKTGLSKLKDEDLIVVDNEIEG